VEFISIGPQLTKLQPAIQQLTFKFFGPLYRYSSRCFLLGAMDVTRRAGLSASAEICVLVSCCCCCRADRQ